jgi:DNA-binding response OmpR family regulator
MKTRRILVIDDDVQSTRMVKLSLERTGRYEVRELNDPVSSVSVARDFKPDLILLDVCMPGLQGVDVAFQIRADTELQQTPVVFISSLVSEWEAVGDGTSQGGFHFVAKPARLPRMITCIEKSLNTTWRADEFSIEGKHP